MPQEQPTITDSQLNDLTHAVCDAIEDTIGGMLGTIGRMEMNDALESMLRDRFGVRVVEDSEAMFKAMHKVFTS